MSERDARVTAAVRFAAWALLQYGRVKAEDERTAEDEAMFRALLAQARAS